MQLEPEWSMQAQKSLKELYEDAEKAQARLVQLVASDADWSDGPHNVRYGKVKAGLGMGGEVIDPGCKSMPRIQEKAEQRKRPGEADPPYHTLVDIARLTICFETASDLLRCLEDFKQAHKMGIVNLKWIDNKFQCPTALGYMDMNLGVGVPLESDVVHIAEVQLSITAMTEAKENAHLDYEKIRSVAPSPKAQRIIVDVLNGPGLALNGYFNDVARIFELAIALKSKQQHQIVAIGLEWPSWANPLHWVRPVQLSHDEEFTLRTFKLSKAYSFSPAHKADTIRAIIEEWGDKEAFEKYVQEELPVKVLEAKRQWFRTIVNVFWDALSLLFGEV